jgi:hypothetical protein
MIEIGSFVINFLPHFDEIYIYYLLCNLLGATRSYLTVWLIQVLAGPSVVQSLWQLVQLSLT